MAQQRGGFVFGWICAFGVMVIARAAFDAPMIVMGVVGLVGYYAVAPGLLLLGMKVSEFFIKASPGGAALLEAHEAEQAAAWEDLAEIKKREAVGENVDPREKARVEGILFRGEGVVKQASLPITQAWERILAAGDAAGIPPGLDAVIREVLLPMRVNPQLFFDNLAFLSVNGNTFLLSSPLSAEPAPNPNPTPSVAARPHKSEWPLGHPLWFIAAFPDVSNWASETHAAAEFKGDAKAVEQMKRYHQKIEHLIERAGLLDSNDEDALNKLMLDSDGKTSPTHGRFLVEWYLEATGYRLETATP
jgi:hypothetical protein